MNLKVEKKAVALVKEKYPNTQFLSYDFYAKNVSNAKSGKALQQCLNDENKIILFGVESDIFKGGDENLMLMSASAFVVEKDEKVAKLRPQSVFEQYKGSMDCIKGK